MKQLLSKKWFRILLLCLCIWLAVMSIDLVRVTGMHEKPLFCFNIFGADDGGSGVYVGLLYHYDIRGDFMPEDVPPHVVEYTWHLIGIPLLHGGPIMKD